MNSLNQLYAHSLSLLTDLYQLTMAYGYWKQGLHQHEAIFHAYFRRTPFNGGYSVAAGLDTALAYIETLQFTAEDVQYLSGLTGNDEQPLFETAFLDYLAKLRFDCMIDAIAEGSLVFSNEPLLRVQGNLVQCQLLETALLNILNFQTLIATKAARLCDAAQGDPVLEFGLRRAQGIDGGITATRAAYIGGCAGTSNVLAGKLFNIPVKGTHAHSWVMAFEDERTAFQRYAESLPNNCIFLVDTYDTAHGVANAIEADRWLRQHGHKMLGVRLDSGDLLSLSQQVRQQLDAAGCTEVKIVASNDLDEYEISRLKQHGARIDLWGVGTRLVTAYDQPALGGVYKLAAIRAPEAAWRYTVKLSEQPAKTSLPSALQVRRFRTEQGLFSSDMLYDEHQPPRPQNSMHYEDLLQRVMLQGRRLQAAESLDTIRARVQQQLASCPPAVRRLDAPETYPVTIEQQLQGHQQQLIAQLRA